MRFVIDLDTLTVIESLTDKRPLIAASSKRGDGASFELIFARSGVAEPLAAGAIVSFGLKPKGKYDADAVVFSDDFTLSGTGAAAKYLADPSFNTTPLNALFAIDADETNDPPFIDLMAEITWRTTGGAPTSTQTFPFRVHNDVLRGDEGTPTSLPDPAEWMPAALTLATGDPNADPGITISGIVTPSAANGFYAPAGLVNGYPSYAKAGYKLFRTTVTYTWMLTTDTVPFATNKFVSNDNVPTPGQVTTWTPISGNVGVPLITGQTPVGTTLGQSLQVLDTGAWYKWDGEDWDPEATDLTPSVIQPFSRIAAIGDSITDAAGSQFSWSQHYLSVARLLAAGRLQIVSNPSTGRPTFAVSGAASQKIQRYYQDKVALTNAQAVIIAIGTNDYPLGRTAAQVAATIGEMADAMIAVGKTPIVCEVLPIPSTEASTAKRAWIVGVNAAIATMISTRPLAILCNWASVLDSNNDGLANSDGDFSDSVHPDFEGHMKIGARLHEVLAPYIAGSDYFQGIQYVSPNPDMAGTLGVGSIATGWATYDGTLKTVTKTLIARAVGLGNWQQLAIAGDAAGGNVDFRYGYGTASGFDVTAGQWAVGDEVELFFEFETDDNLSPLFIFTPRFETEISSAFASRVTTFGGGGGTFTAYPRLASGVMVSPRYVIASGTTKIWPYVNISGTGTIRIGRFGIRRVL